MAARIFSKSARAIFWSPTDMTTAVSGSGAGAGAAGAGVAEVGVALFAAGGLAVTAGAAAGCELAAGATPVAFLGARVWATAHTPVTRKTSSGKREIA